MNLSMSAHFPASWGRSLKYRGVAGVFMSVAIGLLIVTSPAVLKGQGAGPLSSSWTVGLAGGVFRYEPSLSNSFPMIAVRLDRPISKWARFELSSTYTRPEIQRDAGGLYDPSLPAEHTNLFTVTVGVQARYTVGPLEPYGGISAGFFGRYDTGPTDRRFGRSTIQFPLGIRFWATDHIGVRGEYRWNQDSHEATMRSDSETTVGVFWTP